METATNVRNRGRQAKSPTDVPAPGWRDVLHRTIAEAKQDRISLLAAGVAFYFFLALVPALVVAVSVYGLIADPADIRRFVSETLSAAPTEVRQLVTAQLRGIVRSGNTTAGISAVIATIVALWSASSGMGHLVEAVNAAFDEEDHRSFVRKRALSLVLTIAAFAFGIAAIIGIAVLPSLLADTPLSDGARVVIGVLRWPVLAIGMLVGLAVLYRTAPHRKAARWTWVTPGAIVAVVIWTGGSLLFSLYAANLGRFQATYGSLASIAVLLLWLFLTALAIILGAELDAELERQTMKDTTEGPEKPMGQREAYAADTLGPSRHEPAEESM
jgi:membrane protein